MFMVRLIVIALTIVGFCYLLTYDALPHQAPTGWSYHYECCSDRDCRPVGKDFVWERPEGYVIAPTKEIIPHGDKRIRMSPDGDYHWCSTAGSLNGETLCLYVPFPAT